MRTTVAAMAMMGAMLLAGCSAAAANPAPTETGAAPAPSPSASETAAVEPDPADLTTWTITPQGIGPITLGESFSAAQAALPTWKATDPCLWAAFWSAPDHSQSAYFVRDADAASGDVTAAEVEAVADTVTPADGARTAEGIGLGSTRDEVMAAYPDAAVQKASIGDAEFLRVGEPSSAAIYFAFREGQAKVSAITVTAESEPPYEVCG